MLIEPIKNILIEPLIDPSYPDDGYPVVPINLKSNLLAWWDAKRLSPYNPPVDNTWYDYSGNGRNMTMYNLDYTALSTVSPTNGFACDGANDYGVIADSAATRLTTGGTLAAWIYPIGLGELNAGRIFDKSSGGTGADGYMLCLGLNNIIRFFVAAGTGLISVNNAITLNIWKHVAVTFNSTGRHLYVNGVEVTSTGGTETALPPGVVANVTIGNRTGATDATFNGYIDRPMIFSKALSASEVMALFRGSRRRYGV